MEVRPAVHYMVGTRDGSYCPHCTEWNTEVSRFARGCPLWSVRTVCLTEPTSLHSPCLPGFTALLALSNGSIIFQLYVRNSFKFVNTESKRQQVHASWGLGLCLEVTKVSVHGTSVPSVESLPTPFSVALCDNPSTAESSGDTRHADPQQPPRPALLDRKSTPGTREGQE